MPAVDFNYPATRMVQAVITENAPGKAPATDIDPFAPEDLRPNSRLSCQIPMLAALHGLTVTFPDRQV